MLYQGKLRIESSRLQGWDYRTAAWYFVTICIKNHINALGYICNDSMELTLAGEIAEEPLSNLGKHYTEVSVDRFVVMPNHVHALIRIDNDAAETLRSNVSTQEQGCTSQNPDCRYVAPQPLSVPRPSPPKAGSLSAIVRSYKSGVTCACHQAGMFDFEWQTRFSITWFELMSSWTPSAPT